MRISKRWLFFPRMGEKAQAKVRHAELENVGLAARALKGKDEDPDIERKLVVEGASQWAMQPDTK